MAKRVSPTVIGGFVVAALTILVAAIMVLGSGKLFQKPVKFICMFKGDLNGLKVGAAVKFKGVQIGSVSDIRLILSPDQGRLKKDAVGLWLPVIIEIEHNQLTARGGTGAALGGAGFDEMVERGMRAQLNVESLLTGLLYVDLDFHPNSPINYELEGGGPYHEIPTVPTTLESVQKQLMDAFTKLDQIDFKDLVASVADAADSIRNLTNSPHLTATLDGLQRATVGLDKTLGTIRIAINNINAHVDPLAAGFQKNSVELSATLAQTRAALADVQGLLDPDSPTVANLNQSLEQLNQTTRSLNSFTDYLERNPSSLIRGAYVPEKDR